LKKGLPPGKAFAREPILIHLLDARVAGSWWKAFGSNKQMMALAFSTESGALAGLAPFYVGYFKALSSADWLLCGSWVMGLETRTIST